MSYVLTRIHFVQYCTVGDYESIFLSLPWIRMFCLSWKKIKSKGLWLSHKITALEVHIGFISMFCYWSFFSVWFPGGIFHINRCVKRIKLNWILAWKFFLNRWRNLICEFIPVLGSWLAINEVKCQLLFWIGAPRICFLSNTILVGVTMKSVLVVDKIPAV